MIWSQPFDILPDWTTVFNVAELTVDDQKSESFLITWNKSLGMIHLLDEETLRLSKNYRLYRNYLKIRGDQGRI